MSCRCSSTCRKEGEHFHDQGWRFEVVDMDGLKIDKLLVSADRGAGEAGRRVNAQVVSLQFVARRLSFREARETSALTQAG